MEMAYIIPRVGNAAPVPRSAGGPSYEQAKRFNSAIGGVGHSWPVIAEGSQVMRPFAFGAGVLWAARIPPSILRFNSPLPLDIRGTSGDKPRLRI